MILTYEQMKQRLSEMKYYEGWEMSLYVGATEGIHCLIKASIPDNFNKEEKFCFEVYTAVPPMVSLEAFDLWVDWRLGRIAKHESSERLQINGKPVLNPHRENADRDMI